MIIMKTLHMICKLARRADEEFLFFGDITLCIPLESKLVFQRNMLPPSSVVNVKPSNIPEGSRQQVFSQWTTWCYIPEYKILHKPPL
jgi:hypothetical protein